MNNTQQHDPFMRFVGAIALVVMVLWMVSSCERNAEAIKNGMSAIIYGR